MGILDLVEQQKLAKELMNPICLAKGHQHSLVSWTHTQCLRCKDYIPIEIGYIDPKLKEFEV